MSGEMRLDTLEFLRMLPAFMREDLAVKGLASAMDMIIPDLENSVVKLTTWDKIEDLTEDELDALAWELNVMWYDKSANIDTKRDLILNSDKVYRHLGTKWAVENVIRSYFGDGYVQEWNEYDGDPGHFRVYSTNPTLNNERLSEFLNILSKIKRHSAKLDSIVITLSGELKLAAGVGIRETAHETYRIGTNPT